MGSKVELDFHIENAALKFHKNGNYSPLGLLLTGVRKDPQGPLTYLADARKALKQLNEEDIAILREPWYQINVPYRWRNKENTQTHPVPLLEGNLDLPEISAAFYPDMLYFLNEKAEKAAQKFYHALQDVAFGLEILPGHLVYIDNRFTLHSRSAFSPTYDEKGTPLRWIQRVFITNTLWPHRYLETVKPRVFKPVLQN